MDTRRDNDGGSPLAWGLGALGVMAVAGLALWVSGVLTQVPHPSPTNPSASNRPPESAQLDAAAGEARPRSDATAANQVLPAPTFDVVRVAPDGGTVIAGTAPAGSHVRILLDGVTVQTEQVDTDGSFAVLLSLPPAAAPRVLSLVARIDGRDIASDDQIILTPALPAQQLLADPTPDPGPVAGVDAVAKTEPRAATGPSPVPTGAPEAVASSVVDAGSTPPIQTEAAQPAARVAVLRTGVDGVELMPPVPPKPPAGPERIALGTISYSDTGAVLLQGSARGGSVVRIYLDNAPLIDLDTGSDGRWRGQLTDIEPGVYKLRLDELDPAGRVLSRIETPFQRAAPESLRPPVADTAGAEALVRAVTVQAGDTLWAISRARYGEGLLYVRVFQANRDSIRDPDLIYPGQVFTIPQ
ncbi:LysM peptidoglycan-binding domain-containing protein [Sedimentitalea sp. HM32M-2]|uniref:LysM peptidoglycan-binding domain-containing protein n=1 Tax=Sedimentitalea sp. HM32M-2 TaxID=3351566 RepID=UPI0036427F0F